MLRLYKCTHCGLIDWIKTLPCLLCGGKGRVLFGKIPTKDDLGEFKKIVIATRSVDLATNYHFLCVFEKLSIALCGLCPYYQDTVRKCTLFNMYEKQCDVCENEPLCIPYVKILKDMEEVLPQHFVKKCCACSDNYAESQPMRYNPFEDYWKKGK